MKRIDFKSIILVTCLFLMSFKTEKTNQFSPLSVQIAEIASDNSDSQVPNENEKITNTLGMKMIKIKPGSFVMGDNEGNFDEKPAHEVEITRPFYLSATPVSNAQYEQFNPDHKLLRGKRDLSYRDNEAVVFVSWYEAEAFCKWLSEKEGKTYRLPTEAEWEYACRAGTNSPFSTGDSLPGVYNLNQKNVWYPEPVDLTVGKTPPNPWGLYNMHGLVEEWCLDWYGPYSGKTKTNPRGYEKGDYRVTRGGSHNTDMNYLRIANRLGMIPEDKSFLVGFRIVQAEMPSSQFQETIENPVWAQNLKQSKSKWEPKVNMEEPYFENSIYFQNVPPASNGPLYSKHNHCPDITALPNDDLFATWYSTNTEQGRELAVLASRLRKGENKWDAPDLIYKVPDRNMHATSIWYDKETDRILHFQGVAVSFGWGDLALFMRTSSDNGQTWSKPHWINQKHGLRNMPIAGVIKSSGGSLVVPCDAVTGGNGGSAIHVSNDNGVTWHDPGEGSPAPEYKEGNTGGTIAGIHAGVVELKNGRLMALGRGDNINGKMPVSISDDMGKTWHYSASEFPPISSGQRLVLIRLSEGPLLFVSFTGSHDNDEGMGFTDKKGNRFHGYGMFAAISYDEGKTWPVRKLITPGEGEFDGGAWTRTFKTDATHAEPRGYLAATQSPDNVIHLISSKLHYRFNLEWLEN
jgi:formylglycine-generating enzyme